MTQNRFRKCHLGERRCTALVNASEVVEGLARVEVSWERRAELLGPDCVGTEVARKGEAR